MMFRIGEITFPTAEPDVMCLVRDVSERGALIEVRETDSIPESFDLLVPSARLRRPCRVVRRTKHMLGVTFTG